jgi:hypothetical protein
MGHESQDSVALGMGRLQVFVAMDLQVPKKILRCFLPHPDCNLDAALSQVAPDLPGHGRNCRRTLVPAVCSRQVGHRLAPLALHEPENQCPQAAAEGHGNLSRQNLDKCNQHLDDGNQKGVPYFSPFFFEGTHGEVFTEEKDEGVVVEAPLPDGLNISARIRSAAS